MKKQNLPKFIEIHENLARATPVNRRESAAQKSKRIEALEGDPEQWIKYYFPRYATAEPAAFHIAATTRVLANPEWYEVRSWSRELAKSTRTMMEVFYLVLVGSTRVTEGAQGRERLKKRNVLLISNSLDNAERLLTPYLVNLTKNNRIINDYGNQRQAGQWTSTEFVTCGGAAFRAVGAGQSPRGSRNEESRPDVVIFDDLDTDADCLNPDIIYKRWNWVEQAVIPVRSVSNPLLVMWCGNVIAEDCCVVRAQKYADHVDIINIRDEDGISTWPQKNSEADIDRVLGKISYASQQKEYYNNPMNTGRTFTKLVWGKCPPLKDINRAVIYGDPGTSNKDMPGKESGVSTSRKAIFIVGKLHNKYYIYTGYLDHMSQTQFIRCLYEARNYIAGRCQTYFVVECNSLQQTFHDEIIAKNSQIYGNEHGGALSLHKDDRKKPDKWLRIEAELEPINRDGNLVFNEEEKGNPHMERLATQFLAASPRSKQLDGPDSIEGAKHYLDLQQPAKDNVESTSRISRRLKNNY